MEEQGAITIVFERSYATICQSLSPALGAPKWSGYFVVEHSQAAGVGRPERPPDTASGRHSTQGKTEGRQH